jgi:prolyl-tRNA editing enzyme YbaK/EbsC (Cys-tRNA(Pro) deacylase)
MPSFTFTDPCSLHPLVAAGITDHGLHVEVVHCDEHLADTAEFCGAYDFAMEDSANTIVVIGKAAEPVLVACVVLATDRLDVNGVVRRRLGVKKASFAPQERAAEHTGMTRGGVTAIGLPPTMPLWIDRAVMDRTEIVVGGGNRTSKVLLAPAELLKLPNAEVVQLSVARAADGP